MSDTNIERTYIEGLTNVRMYTSHSTVVRPFRTHWYSAHPAWIEILDVRGTPIADAFLKDGTKTADVNEAGQFLLDMCELLFKESV
mgnify:CR=1 FL=1